jgi:hypothetical protein
MPSPYISLYLVLKKSFTNALMPLVREEVREHVEERIDASNIPTQQSSSLSCSSSFPVVNRMDQSKWYFKNR